MKKTVKKTVAKITPTVARKTPPTLHFQCEDCTIYLSTVKPGSVDLVLTDPPYQIARDTNFASGKPKGTDTDRFRVSMDFGEWDRQSEEAHRELMVAFANGTYAALRDGGCAVIWYDYWKMGALKEIFEAAGFRMFRIVKWDKTNPVPLNADKSFLTGGFEQALYCVKGAKPTFNAYYHNGSFALPIPREKRFHPTQKPKSLMESIIQVCSNEGDTVLDPFAGSGTTLVAALGLNRNALGCEMDLQYFNQAKARIYGLELPFVPLNEKIA